MLVSEIITLAEAQCDESYEVPEWIKLINMCLSDLTPVAKNVVNNSDIAVTVANGKATIPIVEDTKLSTAHEILNVYYTPAAGKEVQLRRLSIRDSFSVGWKMDMTNLYLQGLGEEATGTIRVDAYNRLTPIVYSSGEETFVPDTPDIPEQYHNLIVSFICSKSQQREEEPNDKVDFQNEYVEGKQGFAIDRIKQMEPWNIRKLRQMVGGTQANA